MGLVVEEIIDAAKHHMVLDFNVMNIPLGQLQMLIIQLL